MKWLIALFIMLSNGSIEDPYYYTDPQHQPFVFDTFEACDYQIEHNENLRQIVFVVIKRELEQGVDIENFDLKCVLADEPA